MRIVVSGSHSMVLRYKTLAPIWVIVFGLFALSGPGTIVGPDVAWFVVVGLAGRLGVVVLRPLLPADTLIMREGMGVLDAVAGMTARTTTVLHEAGVSRRNQASDVDVLEILVVQLAHASAVRDGILRGPD